MPETKRQEDPTDPSGEPVPAEAGDDAAADDTATGDGDSDPRPALLRELVLTFVASIALTGGLAWIQGNVSALAPWVYIGVAAVFVILPTWVVRRFRGEDPIDAGLRFGSWRRGLAWGLGLTAVTLIPFAIGFHVWSVYFLDQEANPSLANYWQWDDRARGRPVSVDGAASGQWIWVDGDRVRIWWRRGDGESVSSTTHALRLRADDGGIEVGASQGVSLREMADGSGLEVVSLGTSAGIRGVDLRLPPGSGALRISFLDRRGKRLAAEEIDIGGGETPAESNPVVLTRGLLWVLDMLLIQLFFIGLPEEYFYRGYVQPTLVRIYPDARERAVVGRAGRAIVIASVLFAIGHVAIDGQVIRASVFLPSLLFGWLRIRSGGLIAPLIYHGMCNAMVEIAQVHYG